MITSKADRPYVCLLVSLSLSACVCMCTSPPNLIVCKLMCAQNEQNVSGLFVRVFFFIQSLLNHLNLFKLNYVVRVRLRAHARTQSYNNKLSDPSIWYLDELRQKNKHSKREKKMWICYEATKKKWTEWNVWFKVLYIHCCETGIVFRKTYLRGRAVIEDINQFSIKHK